MLFVIAAVVLSQVPVELPRELGHLRLMSSKTTDKGVEIELEYVNVTETTFASVGIECTLFDHREVAVNDQYLVVNNDGQGFAPGARTFAKVIVADHVSRARRAECLVNRANKAKIQLASAPTEEPYRAPIIRERPPEKAPAAEPTSIIKPTDPTPTVNPTPTEPTSILKPAATTPATTTTTPAATVVTTPAAGGTKPAAVTSPAAVTPAPATPLKPPEQQCCKKCSGATKACGDTCIPINEKCREWAGCACTVE